MQNEEIINKFSCDQPQQDYLLTKFNKIRALVLPLFLFLAIHCLNAQDSLDVKWLGSCLGSTARKVAYGEIDGHSYLFVFQHGSILVLDIDNPTNPQKVVETGNPGEPGQTWIGGLAVVDTFLYIAIGPYGLWVYNIADPYAPIRIGTCKTENACGVAVSGDYAYVADLDSGLVIIDISQPSTPIKVSALQLEGSAKDVTVLDTIAYVADGKLQLVNIANPFAPSLISTWNPHGFYEYVIQVAVQSNFVYLANFDLGFWVVDVTDPQSPVSTDSIFYGIALDIAVNGNYAYGAAGDTGIVIINVIDPYNVYLEGTLNTPGSAQGIDYFGNNVFIADLDSILIINVMEPADPIGIGAYDNLIDFAQDVAISSNYAYVAYGEDGLRIVDISNPYFPYEVGYWHTPDIARGVAVSDSFAYVADANSGLRIINITNPFTPYEVGYCNTIGWTEAVAVSGNYAYVVCAVSYLKIIDISNPYAPSLISSLQITDYASRVVKEGKYIYTGGSIIDVSNPYAPFEIGRFPTALGIAVSDDYLSVVEPFRIYDVSDHSSPVLLNFLDILGQGIAVAGDYAFVGSSFKYPVYVIDVADPFNLAIVGYYFTALHAGGGPSYRLAVIDYNIYVTCDDRGLQIFRFTGAPGIEEEVLKYTNNMIAKLEVFPNPFRNITEIKYEITDNVDRNQKTASLKIYDTAGCLVRSFSINQLTNKLINQVIWDGTDDYGKKVASGVYFCRLDIGEFNQTQKILLLR